MILLIGNKNYSSWSMRPWLSMRQLDIELQKVPESRSGIRYLSPNAPTPRLAVALVLACAIALLVGCGGTEPTATRSTASQPERSVPPIGHGSATLNCQTFPFIGHGKADWRKRSANFGPFGMGVTDYAKGSRHGDGLLHTKIPTLVEGHHSVVLTVPDDESDRVGIEVLKPDHPVSKLRLDPCGDRPRTIWAAGVATRDRAPVVLDVEVDGKRRGTITVGAMGFER